MYLRKSFFVEYCLLFCKYPYKVFIFLSFNGLTSQIFVHILSFQNILKSVKNASFEALNEMDGSLYIYPHSLTHLSAYAIKSHLKLVPGFRTCFFLCSLRERSLTPPPRGKVTLLYLKWSAIIKTNSFIK